MLHGPFGVVRGEHDLLVHSSPVKVIRSKLTRRRQPRKKLDKRTHESQAKPGTKMVNPEACNELERRPQLFPAGTAPYEPSSNRVLTAAQMTGPAWQ